MTINWFVNNLRVESFKVSIYKINWLCGFHVRWVLMGLGENETLII
jgi:hypothetical protein